jgi:hypothetical protein
LGHVYFSALLECYFFSIPRAKSTVFPVRERILVCMLEIVYVCGALKKSSSLLSSSDISFESKATAEAPTAPLQIAMVLYCSRRRGLGRSSSVLALSDANLGSIGLYFFVWSPPAITQRKKLLLALC